MDIVKRNGKIFPVRTLEVKLKDSEETTTINISTQSLSDVLDFENDEADRVIDNEIYFYVEDEVINKSGEEICKSHLDEEMEFISEEV